MARKTKIVLASLLKPVDDTRMFEKFGKSLSSTGRYEIHIIGYKPQEAPENQPDIHFHPLFSLSRTSFSRLLAPLKYYIFLIKVKPELIIVNAPDFQAVTVLYKILFGIKISYDIQENYCLNILHTDAFPIFFRPFLALLARASELICSPFFDHFFLAEKVYVRQLKFTGKKFTVVENKYEPIFPLPEKSNIKIAPQKALKMVFTGTISAHYGIIDAINVAKNISHFGKIQFKIIGRCAKPAFLKSIQEQIADENRIEIVAGTAPVAHSEIVRAIREADIGIISYHPNTSTAGRIPTKIYEYMANRLPFLVLHNPEWLDFPLKYHACIQVGDDWETGKLLQEIYGSTFYDIPIPKGLILWEREKTKLLHAVEKLLNG